MFSFLTGGNNDNIPIGEYKEFHEKVNLIWTKLKENSYKDIRFLYSDILNLDRYVLEHKTFSKDPISKERVFLLYTLFGTLLDTPNENKLELLSVILNNSDKIDLAYAIDKKYLAKLLQLKILFVEDLINSSALILEDDNYFLWQTKGQFNSLIFVSSFVFDLKENKSIIVQDEKSRQFLSYLIMKKNNELMNF
jgi:hypothetical protein